MKMYNYFLVFLILIMTGCSQKVDSFEGAIHDIREDVIEVDCSDTVRRNQSGDTTTIGYDCTVQVTEKTLLINQNEERVSIGDFEENQTVKVVLEHPTDIGRDKESREVTAEKIVLLDKDGKLIADACNNPPKFLEWENNKYTLKTVGDRDLEPGMKLGYLDCNGGTYTQQNEGENATFNIYSYGNPNESNALLYFGKWGRALYTK
jgi:hypothetical protein